MVFRDRIRDDQISRVTRSVNEIQAAHAVIGMDGMTCYMRQAFLRGESVIAVAVVRVRFLRRSGGTSDHLA